MLWDYFMRGAVMGFYIAVPIGAISILYIKRTLQNGKSSGIASSLGVTTAETIYAAAAIYGLSFISDFLMKWHLPLQIAGGLFLLFVGIKSVFSEPPHNVHLNKTNSLVVDYLSMVFLTLLNPLGIVGFIAVFAGIGAQNFSGDSLENFVMLCGFSLASFSYCMFLISVSLFVRSKFDTKDRELMKILNKISGLVLILFTISILIFSFSK